MVDIKVGVIPPVQNNQDNSGQQRRTPFKKRNPRDRRRNKADRRRSVREGVFVTLSEQYDRRQTPDRRKATSVRSPDGIGENTTRLVV